MSYLRVLEKMKLVLKPDSSERRIVCVEETDTSKGDIILAFYMWYIFKETKSPVYMVGVRDTYGHYQNVGLKFRYSLMLMCNQKRFVFVEFETSIEGLFDCAKNLMEQHPIGDVYMVIDDVSALLLLGVKLKDIIDFLTYVKCQPRLILVFGCWKHKADESTKRLASAASHLADIKVALTPLVTGFSNFITGTLRITSNESIYQMDDASYKYKLVDNGFIFELNSETVK